ncbi:MAG: ATP-binding protein [bacterium]
MAIFEKTYASAISAESELMADLRCLLADHEVEAWLQHRFVLIVSEAFTNAVVHGNRGNPEKHIIVAVGINADRLTADIIDQGDGSPDRIEARPSTSSTAEGGRGIDLIKHFASRVKIDRPGDKGMRVSITLDRAKSKNQQRV